LEQRDLQLIQKHLTNDKSLEALYHEHLEDHNQPMYFHEFIELAQQSDVTLFI